MSKLVFARNGQAFTTSRIIAESTGNTHQAMLKLVRGYLEDFEAFGRVGFEIQSFETNGGTQKREIAILNEQQATLLVTYCKNTEVVRKFKVALVKAFYEMRAHLQPQCPARDQLPPPMLTESQAYQIMSEVAKRCKANGAHYQTVYRALKARYQVTKYTHIPDASFADAIAFIRSVELRAPEVPQQEPRKGLWLSDHQAKRLSIFLYELYDLFAPSFQAHYDMLVKVKSPDAPRFYEAFHSFSAILLAKYLADNGYGNEATA